MKKVMQFVLFVLLAIFIGCSKDDNNSTGPSNPSSASIPTVTFKGPNTTSTDANATIAKSYATSMNATMSSSAVFASLPAQQSGNTSTWTYNVGGMTYTFTGVKQGDGSYVWTYIFTGTVGGTTYTNFKMWEGTTTANGKSGSWTFYEPGHTGKTDELVYTTNASNVLTGTWYVYDSNGTLTSKMVILNNSDGSGSVEMYDDGTTMNYKSVWIANGSGTWYTYNAGVQTSTGTWQ